MNLNLLKGILVLLVVVDHNEFSRSIFPRFLNGFSFHVLGFLMIPFLRPAHAWSPGYLSYFFRLYFPFLVIVTTMAAVVAYVTPISVAAQAKLWLLALYSGNSAILKQVTLMALLWFLPSFIALVTIRTALENFSKGGKMAALAMLCLAHLFVGTVATSIQHYLPMGLLPALYAVPLAYLGVVLHQKGYARMAPLPALLLASAIFVIIKYLQIRAGLSAELGFAVVADYRSPLAMLLNDGEAVSGVLMLFQLARFRLGAFLELCGKYSLQVYLFHAFVALFVYKALLQFASGWPAVVLFAVSILSTVLLTAAIARLLAEHPLSRRFLFPSSPGELFGVRTRHDNSPGASRVLPSQPTKTDASP